MSKNSIRTTDEIKISKGAYDQLLTYGLSKKEFYAVCGANKQGIIVMVVRIRNHSVQPRSSVEWLERERTEAIGELKRKSLSLAADAHSHPKTNDRPEPSQVDHDYSRPGQVEIIVRPSTSEITAWRYGRSYESTLNNRLRIILISDHKG